ncbi:T9SS type A sorting domain-containing protein [Hymenobacter ruber]
MKNIYYRLLLLPLLLVAWGARAQAPAWVGATGVPANTPGQQVLAVATNTTGDVFVTGSYTGSVTFGTTTLNSKTGGANGNNQDAYVAKWSTANGSWSWAVSIGGDDVDTGYGIAVNGTNVYVTGQYTGNSAAFNGAALTNVAAGEIFVGKLIDGGTTVTNGGVVSAGGAGTDRGNAIAVNGNNVYVTGFVNGAATISGTASTGAGSQDIFVAKYVDAGSTFTNGGALRAGSTAAERGNAIAVNGANIYVGAYFNGATASFGNNSAPPFGATVLNNAVSGGGSSDAVVIKYTDAGSLAFASVVQAGGSDNERINGIAVSGSNVYVTGFFASPSLSIAGTTLTNTAGATGTQDVFVAKYVDGGALAGGGAKSAGGSGGGDDFGNAIAVSGSTVYVTGSYSGAISFDGGTTTVPLSGFADVFVAKYTDASGLTLNGAIGGGSATANGNIEAGTGIAVSGSQAIVGGFVDALPATFGSSQVTTGGGGFFARVGLAPTTVTSIVPAAANPTNAASVTFTVTFAASVTGLTTSNFTTANGGSVTGSSVTSVSGSGTTYTVTVNTGSGSGTLGLTLANDTGLNPGISNDPFTGTPLYTIDKTAPTVTITSSTAANGGTSSNATFAYTVTFSESVTGFVTGDITVANGTISGFAGSGTTYTFNVTPTANGAVTVTVPANVAQDAVGNGNAAGTPSPYSITYTAPNTTVSSITRLTPSPTATAQVSYRVVFAAAVTGVTVSNFSVTTTSGSVSGASVSSTSGSGTTYTVVVNTGTGDGTLRLNLQNSTGISPTVTNVPYTAGEEYTITKSFAAAPTLRIQAAGSASGNSDVTAFVDVVQVLSGGTPVANGLQNGSFETNNVPASDFLYQQTGVVASPWTFTTQAGVSRNGSAFGSTAASGDAVAILQSSGGTNGSISQNLAVPTGSYQVSFQTIQRNYTSLDQRLNVFLNNGINDVFVGNIQPNNIPTYNTFTSASFNVFAPALTATVSTTSGSPTSTAPIPFSVSFSQSVGTTFTASDVTVTGGTLNAASFSGSGAGPYTFTVTPSGTGTVTVSLAANVATDANNTQNTASNAVSVQYNQPVTAAPVVTAPANGSQTNNNTPTYSGTAPANSTVTVYVDGSSRGTTTADASGNWTFVQPTALSQGSHTVYATAQTSGSSVSANSNTNTFTVDTTRPSVVITSSTAANGGTTSTSPLAFTVTFSENVNGSFVQGDVTVTNGTISGFTTVVAGTTFTFNVTPTASGAVTVTVPANVAQDAAGNFNTAGTPSPYSITYTPVTATPVVTAPANGSLTNNPTPTYTGTAVANSTVTVYVDGSSIGATTADASGNWTLTQPSALSQGSHTVYATAQSSGSSVSANSSTNTFTVDTTRPSVAISSTAGTSGSTTGTTPIPFTVTFSETVTGFVTGDITVSNGTISGFSGSGATYTFNVTPTTPGTATTVNVPANVAQDAAGNFNTAAPAAYSITYQQPLVATSQSVTVNLNANGTATLNASSVNNGSTGSGTLTYTIQKIVRGRVNEGSTLTLTTPNGANFTAIRFASYGTPTDDGNGNYRLGSCNAANSIVTATNSYVGRSTGSMDAVNGASANNNPTLGDPCGGTPKLLAVQAGYSADAASLTYDCTEANKTQYVLLTVSNGTTTSTSVAQVTVNPAPTATITSLNPTSATPGTLVTVSGTNLSGLTGVTLNGAPVTATNVSGTGFQFTVPTNATSGNVVVTLPCSQTLTLPFTVVTPAPVVTAPANGSLLNTRTPAYTGTAPANSTVTVYVDGASIGTTTATAGGSFSLTQPSNLADGSHTVYATAQASGTSVSVNSNTNSFTIDATRPSVAITSSAGASGATTTTSPIPFTVTFSESVNGSFVQGDLTVSNGTISGFTTVVAGTTFTFNVTPTTVGTATTVTVPANVAQDAAGNFNTAGTPSPYALTFLAPAITLAPASVPGGTVGVAYSQALSASGGTAPYTYAITAGALPSGLSLTNGTLSGTPTASGSFTFTVMATDNSAAPGPYSGSRTYTVAITAPTITLAPTTLPNGTQGVAYSQALSASGGTAPYTYAITAGALPSGVSLTGGTISGTSTANGTFNFTVTATDAFGSTGSQAYSLVIAAPVVTAVTWTGNLSTDWFTAGNWTSNTVPTATINAIIPTSPSGGRFPALTTSATANARNLTLNSGSTLTHTDGTLALAGNLTHNGSYLASSPSGFGTGPVLSLGAMVFSNIVGSSPTRFWNLTVGSNGALLATSAGAVVQRVLTLDGNFSTNGNSFTLESNSSGTAMIVNNGSNVVNGDVTVKRYIAPDLNPGLGYRHYSAPVSTATVGSLTTGSFTPVVNPTYNTSATPNSVRPFPTVYYYDQDRLATSTNNLAPFDKGWTSPSALTDPLTVGKGYTVNLAANQTLAVTGPQNNGTVALGLNRNSGATAPDAGWQLVGNPYPSPLDYSLVPAADRAGLDAAMYVFESTSLYGGTYRANVNGVGGNANSPNAILAQGQGFFVRVSNGQTSGTLTLRNSHRVTAYQNPVYHRTTETRPLVQLDLQGASGSDPLYVYFEQAATAGTDAEFDAVKLPNSTGLNLAAWAGSDKMAINALPLTSTASVTVPLFIGLPVTGTYTLHAAQVLNFGAGEQPFLRDLQLGTLTDLSLHPDYTFTMNAANTTPRFELVFGARVLGVASAKLSAQVAVYPNPASKAVFVELPAALNRKAVTAALIDGLGRVVLTQALPAGQPTYTLPLTNLATGVYSLRLQTEAGVVVKKLVVE